MGNANIDKELKKEIEKLLENTKHRVHFQNVKGFIDNACLQLIEKIKREGEK